MTDPQLPAKMILGGNRIFAPSASATVSCGKAYDFAAWAATGVDPGSTIADVPDVPTMMGWVTSLLGI